MDLNFIKKYQKLKREKLQHVAAKLSEVKAEINSTTLGDKVNLKKLKSKKEQLQIEKAKIEYFYGEVNWLLRMERLLKSTGLTYSAQVILEEITPTQQKENTRKMEDFLNGLPAGLGSIIKREGGGPWFETSIALGFFKSSNQKREEISFSITDFDARSKTDLTQGAFSKRWVKEKWGDASTLQEVAYLVENCPLLGHLKGQLLFEEMMRGGKPKKKRMSELNFEVTPENLLDHYQKVRLNPNISFDGENLMFEEVIGSARAAIESEALLIEAGTIKPTPRKRRM